VPDDQEELNKGVRLLLKNSSFWEERAANFVEQIGAGADLRQPLAGTGSPLRLIRGPK
jgi:hypothetical protein